MLWDYNPHRHGNGIIAGMKTSGGVDIRIHLHVESVTD